MREDTKRRGLGSRGPLRIKRVHQSSVISVPDDEGFGIDQRGLGMTLL
jgi:hypothetical protein